MSIVYDPHQTNLENIQTKELVKIRGNKYKILFSNNGPFYADSVKVYNGDTELKLHDQYEITHTYCKAILRTARYISGGIWIKDKALTGPFYLTYHPIGINNVTEALLDAHIAKTDATEPYTRYWDEIVGDLYFPPVNVQFDDAFIGEKELMDYLSTIAISLSSKYEDKDRMPYYLLYMGILIDNLEKVYNNSAAHEHVLNKSNPHRITIAHFCGMDKDETVADSEKMLGMSLDDVVSYILNQSNMPTDYKQKLLKSVGDKIITGSFTPETFFAIAKGTDVIKSFMGFDESITTLGASKSVDIVADNFSFVDNENKGLTLDSEKGLLFLGKELISEENIDKFRPQTVVDTADYNIEDTDTVKVKSIDADGTINLNILPPESDQELEVTSIWKPTKDEATQIKKNMDGSVFTQLYLPFKDPLVNTGQYMFSNIVDLEIGSGYIRKTLLFCLAENLTDDKTFAVYSNIQESKSSNYITYNIKIDNFTSDVDIKINDIDNNFSGWINVKIDLTKDKIYCKVSIKYTATDGTTKETDFYDLTPILNPTGYDYDKFNYIGCMLRDFKNLSVGLYGSKTVNDIYLKKSSDTFAQQYFNYAAEPSLVEQVDSLTSNMVLASKASINGKLIKNGIVFTKSDIGLNNVANVADKDLTLSTAAKNMLDKKSIKGHGHDWSTIIPVGTDTTDGLVYLSDNTTDKDKALDSSKILDSVNTYLGLHGGNGVSEIDYGMFLLFSSSNYYNIDGNIITINKNNCFLNGTLFTVPSAIFDVNDYIFIQTIEIILYIYVNIKSDLSEAKYILYDRPKANTDLMFEIGSVTIANGAINDVSINNIMYMFNYTKLNFHNMDHDAITNPANEIVGENHIETNIKTVVLPSYDLGMSDQRLDYTVEESTSIETIDADSELSNMTLSPLKYTFPDKAYTVVNSFRGENQTDPNITTVFEALDVEPDYVYVNRHIHQNEITDDGQYSNIPLLIGYRTKDAFNNAISTTNTVIKTSQNTDEESLEALNISNSTQYTSKMVEDLNIDNQTDAIIYNVRIHRETVDTKVYTYLDVGPIINGVTIPYFSAVGSMSYYEIIVVLSYHKDKKNILVSLIDRNTTVDITYNNPIDADLVRVARPYEPKRTNGWFSYRYTRNNSGGVAVNPFEINYADDVLGFNGNFIMNTINNLGNTNFGNYTNGFNLMTPLHSILDDITVSYPVTRNTVTATMPLLIYAGNINTYNSLLRNRKVPKEKYCGIVLSMLSAGTDDNMRTSISLYLIRNGSPVDLGYLSIWTRASSNIKTFNLDVNINIGTGIINTTIIDNTNTTRLEKSFTLTKENLKLFKYVIINSKITKVKSSTGGYAYYEKMLASEKTNKINFKDTKMNVIDFIDNYSLASLLHYDEQPINEDFVDYDLMVDSLPEMYRVRINDEVVTLDKNKITQRFKNSICKRLYKNFRGFQ